MNQNLAPTFEDLNSPAVDVAQGIGEIAVLAYEEGVDPTSTASAKPITFDSFI